VNLWRDFYWFIPQGAGSEAEKMETDWFIKARCPHYDKEVFNGDIGRIAKIEMEDQEVTVDFDGRLVKYDFSDLSELILGSLLWLDCMKLGSGIQEKDEAGISVEAESNAVAERKATKKGQ
jgi:hypothetical protein